MADVGQQLIGTGVNMAVGRGINALTGRGLPVPIPSFYNPNSPNPWTDSQINQMIHGNPQAWAQYGRRAVGSAIDAGLMATPLGAPNAAVRFVSGLFGHPISIGGLLSNLGNRGQPRGTVGGAPAQLDQAGNPTAGGVTIDPWTGQQLAGGGGLSSYVPNFTGGVGYSPYGPYSGGYQGLAQQPQYDFQGGDTPTFPDFSNYGNAIVGNTDSDGNFIVDQPRSHQQIRQDLENRMNGFGDFRQSGLYGVSNFMVGGTPVIGGVRPGMGDMNGMMVYNAVDRGG